MERLTIQTALFGKPTCQECFSEPSFDYSSNSSSAQFNGNTASSQEIGRKNYGPNYQGFQGTSANVWQDGINQSFDPFEISTTSTDIWDTAFPWNMYGIPVGDGPSFTNAPISTDNTSWTLDSNSFIDSNSKGNFGSNGLPLIGYWTFSSSSPEIVHNQAPANQAIWGSPQNRLVSESSFEQASNYSLGPPALTPTSDIQSTDSSLDVPAGTSYYRNPEGENRVRTAVSMDKVSVLQPNSASNINTRNTGGQSVLHFAAEKGHLSAVKQLLKLGANLGIRDSQCKTPLHLAATEGHVAMVQVLLDAGANINSIDANGQNALHLACEKQHLAVAKVLVERGIELNARSTSGLTPLHCAAESGCDAVVRLLLERGADANAKSDNG